jgi:hypothetical protein
MALDLSTTGTDVEGRGPLQRGAASAGGSATTHNSSSLSVTGTHNLSSLSLGTTVQSNSDRYEFEGNVQSGPSSFRGTHAFRKGFRRM